MCKTEGNMDLGDLLGPVDLHAEKRWKAIDELID